MPIENYYTTKKPVSLAEARVKTVLDKSIENIQLFIGPFQKDILKIELLAFGRDVSTAALSHFTRKRGYV